MTQRAQIISEELARGLFSSLERVEPYEFISTQNVFHDLVSCIIEQQIHYRKSRQIFKRLLDKAGIDELSTDSFHLFEEKAIPTVKISQNKYLSLQEAFQFFAENDVDWQRKSDHEVKEILSGIRGIGSWTIDMILLFTLNRDNVFPERDYQVVKVLESSLGIEKLKPSMLRDLSAHWSPKKSEVFLKLLNLT